MKHTDTDHSDEFIRGRAQGASYRDVCKRRGTPIGAELRYYRQSLGRVSGPDRRYTEGWLHGLEHGNAGPASAFIAD